MSIESSLESALKQFDQPEAVLKALLAAWNESRSPDVASLVERAGARVKRPPVESKPPDKALAAWLGCAKKKDPADVDRLVAALQVGKVKEIIQRLEVLASAPKDPRFTSLAATLLETQPFRSGAARPIYTSIIALLEAQDDPRTLGRLEIIKARFMPGKGLEGGTDFRDFFTAKIDRAIEKAKQVKPAVALDAASTKHVKALAAKFESGLAAAKHDATGEDALLAAVWAKPADDGPRQVYADFLAERAKPHGEFITLQLAHARGALDAAGRKRMNALLKAHAREFLGPLLPAITLTNLRFERGFVAHCELADKVSPQIQALEAHPAWSTVKSFFAFTGDKVYPKMIKHLRSLGAAKKKTRAALLAQFG